MKKFLFVMIFDFVGLDAMTKNPIERFGVYYYNRVWSRDYRLKRKPVYDLALFVGEEEDIPDKSFGLLLPNRREFAKAMYTFAGYIFPFEATQYYNKQQVRKKLGYGTEPLLICSSGGTAIGKELMELCGRAYLIAKEKIPDLRIILAAGPRLQSESLDLPDGIEVKGFIPRLYEHFAACDIAIVQGGATSTLELTALQKPFIYFPIEGHCEQENVSIMLKRHEAGIRLNFSQTTPEQLAERIIENIAKEIHYSDIPCNGAKISAEAITDLLKHY